MVFSLGYLIPILIFYILSALLWYVMFSQAKSIYYGDSAVMSGAEKTALITDSLRVPTPLQWLYSSTFKHFQAFKTNSIFSIYINSK